MFVKEIIKMINEIDGTIDIVIEKDFAGKGLTCEPMESVIYLGMRNTPQEQKAFNDFVNELEPNFYNKYKINPFILAILHEIGHIMTHEEEQEKEYNFNVNLLCELEDNGFLTTEQQTYFYTRLTLEKWATEWAIDFVKENIGFLSNYQNKIIKRLVT